MRVGAAAISAKIAATGLSNRLDAYLLNAQSKLGQNIDDVAASLAANSTRTAGTADRVVLGKWEGEYAGYVGEAKANGGTWYQLKPDALFETMTKALSDSEKQAVAWKVNEAFLKQQMQAGVARFDFVGLTPEQTKLFRPDSFAAKEVLFLEQNASNYGYIRSGSSWVKK